MAARVLAALSALILVASAASSPAAAAATARSNPLAASAMHPVPAKARDEVQHRGHVRVGQLPKASGVDRSSQAPVDPQAPAPSQSVTAGPPTDFGSTNANSAPLLTA